MGEFDLIATYFWRRSADSASSVSAGAMGLDVGIGDDCAVWTPAPNTQLCISSDMLVEGRHFLSTVNPEALGHKALAVNLSDLAACGASPRAFTLALSLPRVDQDWLAGFSRGLLALADRHHCQLIGGDTTQGPLNICITVFGEVPKGKALLRSGAQAGDDIYVSGAITASGDAERVGQARMALEVFRGNLSLPQHEFDNARARMERPTPRVSLGAALRGLASSAIDISDGLLGDLGHILAASLVGATVQTDWVVPPESYSLDHALEFALSGGDDYELLFTANPDQRGAVVSAAAAAHTQVMRIGVIDASLGLRVLDPQGAPMTKHFASFDHFQTA